MPVYEVEDESLEVDSRGWKEESSGEFEVCRMDGERKNRGDWKLFK